jgi:hypothetical protein
MSCTAGAAARARARARKSRLERSIVVILWDLTGRKGKRVPASQLRREAETASKFGSGRSAPVSLLVRSNPPVVLSGEKNAPYSVESVQPLNPVNAAEKDKRICCSRSSALSLLASQCSSAKMPAAELPGYAAQASGLPTYAAETLTLQHLSAVELKSVRVQLGSMRSKLLARLAALRSGGARRPSPAQPAAAKRQAASASARRLSNSPQPSRTERRRSRLRAAAGRPRRDAAGWRQPRGAAGAAEQDAPPGALSRTLSLSCALA